MDKGSSKDFSVIKRNGTLQKFDEQKLLKRIQIQSKGLENEHVSAEDLTERIEKGLYDKVTTNLIDELSAQTAAYLAIKHPNYSTIAGRIVISNMHKTTPPSFSKAIEMLKNESTLISKEVFNIVENNKDELDKFIDHQRDYNFNYFGIMTLLKSYLLRSKKKQLIERPQYMWLRVSIGIHGNDLKSVKETYDLMSKGMFVHASPTLFNSGTVRPQMSSCFLVCMKEDSIEGIYDTLKTCALISKSAGGIGVSVSNIRAKGSHIRKTNGTSNGLIPMLRVFNDTAKYVDQGGGKRNGAFAVYLEPWHSDISEFLNLKKNHGKEEMRARDLFYALWIPDLFMERVKTNAMWSLFCPDECPGLNETYGEEFEKLYVKYEKEGKARKTIKAQSLWFEILESQTETGGPFMMYKDACNRKSNQQNLGVIKSSNLCTEIVQYTSPEEVAVCNLASVALPKFIKKNQKTDELEYDFQELYKIVKIMVKNLNKIIDKNYYPVPEAKNSNLRHRPIGLGVQGLADVFAQMRYPWDSKEASQLNKDIFETIYFAALTSSMEISKIDGPYSSFKGSPVSKGILQYHMWNVKPSNRWDWESLIKDIKKYGVRNSLLCSPMPTASTSQILGNNECIEPFTCNIYARRVLSGEFPIINPYLVLDLERLSLWDEDMCKQIIVNGGSIQHIRSIPKELKLLYKNVWEISQKVLITLAAERAPYIDQSQSLNIFMENPTTAKMSSMHFYGWSMGLKTGMYYLRSTPAVNPIQFTIDPEKYKKSTAVKDEKSKDKKIVKKRVINCQDEEGCLMCGS